MPGTRQRLEELHDSKAHAGLDDRIGAEEEHLHAYPPGTDFPAKPNTTSPISPGSPDGPKNALLTSPSGARGPSASASRIARSSLAGRSRSSRKRRHSGKLLIRASPSYIGIS